MSLSVTINGKEMSLSRSPILIVGKDRYETSRALYYLLRTLNLMPRLYGVKAENPLEGWRIAFRERFRSILKSNLEPGKVRLGGKFVLDTGPLIIKGELKGWESEVEVETKDIPKEVGEGVKGMIETDSFYFTRMWRPRPFIIPGSKDGILAGFHRFLLLQTEGAPGIPKTLGIIAEFINSIVLPHNYRTEVLGRIITVNLSEGLYIDGSPLYNADPEVLSVLAIRLGASFAPEGSVLIIEDPEAHLSKESKLEVIKELSSFKGELVLVTDDEGFGNLGSRA